VAVSRHVGLIDVNIERPWMATMCDYEHMQKFLRVEREVQIRRGVSYFRGSSFKTLLDDEM
jgi:hypothetical protein